MLLGHPKSLRRVLPASLLCKESVDLAQGIGGIIEGDAARFAFFFDARFPGIADSIRKQAAKWQGEEKQRLKTRATPKRHGPRGGAYRIPMTGEASGSSQRSRPMAHVPHAPAGSPSGATDKLCLSVPVPGLRSRFALGWAHPRSPGVNQHWWTSHHWHRVFDTHRRKRRSAGCCENPLSHL